MTTAQKRAIWYSYEEKRQARMKEYITKYNLMYDFKCSNYKTLRGYLKSMRSRMMLTGENTAEISEAEGYGRM